MRNKKNKFLFVIIDFMGIWDFVRFSLVCFGYVTYVFFLSEKDWIYRIIRDLNLCGRPGKSETGRR